MKVMKAKREKDIELIMIENWEQQQWSQLEALNYIYCDQLID